MKINAKDPAGRHFEVWHNGKRLENVYEVDTDKEYTLDYVFDEDGRPVIDDVGHSIKKVKVDRPGVEIRRIQ